MWSSYSPQQEKKSFSVLLGWALIISAPAPTKTEVAVDESKAKEFLGSLKRQKRQLWDRSRPDVQQWYQQFLYMGFDEAVGILSCWGLVSCRPVWLRENRAQKLASLFLGRYLSPHYMPSAVQASDYITINMRTSAGIFHYTMSKWDSLIICLGSGVPERSLPQMAGTSRI